MQFLYVNGILRGNTSSTGRNPRVREEILETIGRALLAHWILLSNLIVGEVMLSNRKRENKIQGKSVQITKIVAWIFEGFFKAPLPSPQNARKEGEYQSIKSWRFHPCIFWTHVYRLALSLFVLNQHLTFQQRLSTSQISSV